MVSYRALNADSLTALIELEMSLLNKRLGKHGVSLSLEASAVKYLESHYDARYGARNIKRIFRNKLEPAIARAVNKNKDASVLSASFAQGQLVVQ